MVDEIFDRGYQAGRADLNNGIDTLVRTIGAGIGRSLDALRRIQFDAPWLHDGSGRS